MVKVKNTVLIVLSMILCAVLLSAVFLITKPQTNNEITLKAETLSESDLATRRANPGLYQTGKMEFVQDDEGNNYTWDYLRSKDIISITNNNYFQGQKVRGLKVSSSIAAGDLVCGEVSGLPSLKSAFQGCSNLTAIDVFNLDTSSVLDMASMFYGCEGLTTLDVTSLDTSNVIGMDNMFSWSGALQSITFGDNFVTSSVTSLWGMFKCCSGFTSLDVSKFDTSSVTRMDNMFQGCSGLTSLDLSSLDMSNVTYTGYMLDNCNKLTSIKLPSTIDKMTSQTIDLPTSWSIEGAHHYALTTSPSTKIESVSKTIYNSGKVTNPVVELYNSSNVSLVPVEKPQVSGIRVTTNNGKAYEYTESAATYGDAISSLTSSATVNKVNDAIGVFDLVAEANATVTLQISGATVTDVNNVHVMHYNGKAWEDVTTSVSAKSYNDGVLTLTMKLSSYSPIVVVEAIPTSTGGVDVPSTGVVGDSLALLFTMICLAGLVVVINNKKKTITK